MEQYLRIAASVPSAFVALHNVFLLVSCRIQGKCFDYSVYYYVITATRFHPFAVYLVNALIGTYGPCSYTLMSFQSAVRPLCYLQIGFSLLEVAGMSFVSILLFNLYSAARVIKID